MHARRTRCATTIALGIAAALGARDASAWEPVDDTVPIWTDLPVVYRVNQGSIPGSISAFALARIDGGFAEWASPDCTGFAAQNGGDTTALSNYQDGINTVRWQSGSWPAQLGDVSTVIGATVHLFDDTQMYGAMYDADITFNNVAFCWNDTGSNGCVDVGSIATHEEGHFLGLGHSDVDGATMVTYYDGGTSLRSIEADDVDGVCALYPVGGGGGDCMSCADASSQGGACTSQYDACGNSAECVAFYECLIGCNGADACIDGCTSQYPAGADIYIALSECLCADCAEPCAAQCGGGSSSSSSADAASSGASSAGAGGAAAAGGTTSAGVGAGSDDDGGSLKENDDDPESSSGCSCRAGGSSGVTALALLFGWAALAAAARRRRR